MSFAIHQGDLSAVLATLEAASFDACLSDPPYGLSFMGKAWDHSVPGSDVWREVLRILKPGAPLLAFGGTRTFHRLACAIEDAGFILSDTLCWLHGQGFPKGRAQLKPAWEPITLAWKKGKRWLSIDAGRIDAAGEKRDMYERRPCAPKRNAFSIGLTHSTPVEGVGRWPANVILDAESAAALDEQSGFSVSVSGGFGGNDPGMWEGKRQIECGGHNDSGGASRFFYCAKASPRERDNGGPNQHPTVKPVNLATYLAKLLLPPDQGATRRILVPFCGSGSEIIGALRAGWDEAVGIEISAEYCELARRRITADGPLLNQMASA